MCSPGQEKLYNYNRTISMIKFPICSNLDPPFRSLPNICKEKPALRQAWAATEDEEKFQKEIMSEEPNLIKVHKI